MKESTVRARDGPKIEMGVGKNKDERAFSILEKLSSGSARQISLINRAKMAVNFFFALRCKRKKKFISSWINNDSYFNKYFI